MDNGYIKAYRKLFTSDLWLGEKFTRGQAWLDLINLCNWRDGFIRVRGKKINVKRGQCGWSEVKLGSRWGWSRGKVKRFIKELKNEQQIVQQTNTFSSLITVINYEHYQGGDTTNEHQTGQQTNIKQDTNKERKEKKEGEYIKEKIKKENPVREFFESQNFQPFIISFQDKYPNAEEEIQKFWMYWTEPTLGGKKQRWETQKTFEVNRRLITWMNNSLKYQSNLTPNNFRYVA